MNIKWGLFIIIFIENFASAEQDLHPRWGVMASTTENASIKYSCSKPKSDASGNRQIECELSYQKLKKGNPKSQKSQIEAEFKKNGIPSEMCSIFGKKNIVIMTQAEIQAEVSKDNTLNSFNKEIIAEMTPILQKMCKEKTLESLNKLIDFTENIEVNTCEIETRIIKENFSELSQKKMERSFWISEGKAYPPCGKKEIIKIIPIKNNLWSIQFEHIILEKQVKNDGGKLCKDLDGIINIFNSSNTILKPPCKYIKLESKESWLGPFNPN
jgi:hypothetical protein